jgi:hypothetical protein
LLLIGTSGLSKKERAREKREEDIDIAGTGSLKSQRAAGSQAGAGGRGQGCIWEPGSKKETEKEKAPASGKRKATMSDK